MVNTIQDAGLKDLLTMLSNLQLSTERLLNDTEAVLCQGNDITTKPAEVYIQFLTDGLTNEYKGDTALFVSGPVKKVSKKAVFKELPISRKEYSDSIQVTIDELIRLNGEITKCNQAIIEATTNWKASSDESAESMTAIKNKLDELYNRFASVVDESIGHVRSSTEQYSTLLDNINTKLQEKYDNMSDGIAELKQSVGILDSRVKRVTVISIVATCILFIMGIINIFL